MSKQADPKSCARWKGGFIAEDRVRRLIGTQITRSTVITLR